MKSRYNYLDYSKALAIILVVTGHLCLFAINDGDVASADKMRLYRVLTMFQMPLFFFISGCVIKSENKVDNISKKMYVKFRQLIVPFLFFGIIYTYFVNKTFWDFISPVMKLGYWYLLVLFEFYILYYLFGWLSQMYAKSHYSKIIDLIIVIAIYIPIRLLNKDADVNHICWQNTLSLIQVQRYFPYFFLAILLRKSAMIEKVFANKYTLYVSALICIVAVALVLFGIDIPLKGYWLPWFCVGLTLSVLQKFENIENVFTKGMLFIGQRTLDIYLFHYFIVYFIKLNSYTVFYNRYNYFTLETIGIFPISLAVACVSIFVLGGVKRTYLGRLVFYKP